MENAVDALKVVLAIIVFAIGLVLLFSMASRARETAEILISEVDRTKYYTPLDSTEVTMDNNGNRIVTIKDIIPAIYRYSEENYGVTIVDRNGNIIARFDLDTEAACNNWLSVSQETKEKFVEEIDNEVIRKVNKLVQSGQPRVNTIENVENMTELFRRLYAQNTLPTITRAYYCYWLGNMGWTAQRIDSDLSRNRC